MIFYGRENGIIPDTDISKALYNLTEKLSGIDGEKTLIIDSGNYYFDFDNCKEDKLFITNTVGDDEFSSDETPHIARYAIYLKNIDNLKISAKGAVFHLNGRLSNTAIINCKNIEINGLEIKHVNPECHEITVTDKTEKSVDFSLDTDSRYTNKNGEFFFTAKNYEQPFLIHLNNGWFGKIFADNQNHIRRQKNPFNSAEKIEETAPHKFRVYYPSTERFDIGDTYCIFETRRDNVGIFIDKSENIVLKNIKQRFNYSLAVVAQDSKDITIDSVEFSPAENQNKKLVSLADFIQICMCRGLVEVKNSFFKGAGDDCINVHGVHYKIIDISGNNITVRYMHNQTHGFNPLRVGDKIEYINPYSLTSHGKATIKSSEMLNEYDILLAVDNTDFAKSGDVIEDISACPDLIFRENKMTRIITRGVLVTTRGKVIIESNDFDNTDMAAIFVSDDAKSWYESGRCLDVTIKNNRFGDCYAENIVINPENGDKKSIVHGDFIIENNRFESNECIGITAHSCNSITLKNNNINSDSIKISNVLKVDI